MENYAKNVIERLKIYAVYIIAELALLGVYFGTGIQEWYEKVWNHFGLSYTAYVQWWFSSEKHMVIAAIIGAVCLSMAVDMAQIVLHQYRSFKETDSKS